MLKLLDNEKWAERFLYASSPNISPELQGRVKIGTLSARAITREDVKKIYFWVEPSKNQNQIGAIPFWLLIAELHDNCWLVLFHGGSCLCKNEFEAIGWGLSPKYKTVLAFCMIQLVAMSRGWGESEAEREMEIADGKEKNRQHDTEADAGGLREGEGKAGFRHTAVNAGTQPDVSGNVDETWVVGNHDEKKSKQ